MEFPDITIIYVSDNFINIILSNFICCFQDPQHEVLMGLLYLDCGLVGGLVGPSNRAQ